METREIQIDGAVVYWTPAPCGLSDLSDKLRACGFDALAPRETTDASALRAAIADYGEAHATLKGVDRMVRPLKQPKDNGFESVQVERGSELNDYAHDFSAKVVAGAVVVTRGYCSKYELQELFGKYKRVLSASAVGAVMSSAMDHLGAVRLRENGGVYWLRREGLRDLQRIAEAVEGSACWDKKPQVYIVSTPLDTHTIRAVKDAVVNEMLNEAFRLGEELCGGLGDEAKERRKDHIGGLIRRTQEYETLLGKSLSEVSDVLVKLQEKFLVDQLSELAEMLPA